MSETIQRQPILPGIRGRIWWDGGGAPWEELPDGALRCVTNDGYGPGEPENRPTVEFHWGPLVPDAPRVWAMPDEPGPEVRTVRDRDGRIWLRDADTEPDEVQWTAEGDLWPPKSWPTLLAYNGPLTDATAELTD